MLFLLVVVVVFVIGQVVFVVVDCCYGCCIQFRQEKDVSTVSKVAKKVMIDVSITNQGNHVI